ncbi:MAG: hypothetical protein ACTSYN_01540, partial [Candidatus Heimdallarchaeaceae archaeon]
MNKENTTDFYEEKQDTKKSRWGIGLLFFTVYTLLLMFILEAALHPRENYIGAVISYTLGVLGLIIFSILVRKKTRVLLSFPLLLIIVFGSGYLLHLVNAPVYNPFAPVSERMFSVVNTAEKLIEQNPDFTLPGNMTYDELKPFIPLITVADLVIAIPLFTFGLFGITWFVQIFTKKPKWSTILAVILALTFFVTGVIVTPYIHLVLGGVLGVATNVVTGGLYVTQGATSLTDIENASAEEINAAVGNFSLASDYFSIAAKELKGLRSIGFFALLGFIPRLQAITDGLYSTALAALYLSEGLGPFVNGSYYVITGLQEAVNAFEGNSTQIPLSTGEDYNGYAEINQINDALFNAGLEKVNEGLLILADTIENINNALDEAQNVDIDQILTDLQDLGLNTADIEPQLRNIEDYFDMFDGSVAALSALVRQPTINGTQSPYAVLTHFLYGAYNLIKAGDAIGSASSFNGTSTYFVNAAGNLSVVYSEITKPDVRSIADSDTPILNDSVRFLIDMTGLTVSLADFGSSAASLFDDLQTVLENFDVGYENITDYSGLLTILDSLVTQTDAMVITANLVDSNITLIYNTALNNGYGQLNQPAYELSTQLKQFNFTRDITNANAIAHSFYHLFGAMENLKYTYLNITAGQQEFENTQYLAAAQRFHDANTSLYASMHEMDQAIYYMNKTEEGGMVQLQTTRDALVIIRNNLDTIVQDISDIIAICEG